MQTPGWEDTGAGGSLRRAAVALTLARRGEGCAKGTGRSSVLRVLEVPARGLCCVWSSPWQTHSCFGPALKVSLHNLSKLSLTLVFYGPQTFSSQVQIVQDVISSVQ